MTQEELNEIFATTDNLSDKDSKEYQVQSMINKEVRNSLDNESENNMDPLGAALKEAAHLDEATKERYLKIAEYYISDMAKNILLDQFELNKKYNEVSIDEWNDFLSDRIVSTYITKHKRTLLRAAAEFNLSLPGAKNKRDSLQVIKNIEEQEQGEANKNICIIRLPDVYDE